MSKLLVNGILINSNKKYVKFTKVNKPLPNNYEVNSILGNTLEFNYNHGLESKDISHPSVTLYESQLIEETDYIDITNKEYNLNGLVFIKVVPYDHVLRIILVSGLATEVILHDKNNTVVFISENDVDKSLMIEDLFQNLKYIKLVRIEGTPSFANFLNIIFSTRELKVISKNKFIYKPTSEYDKYKLKMIDALVALKRQFGDHLKQLGFELIKHPISESTKSPHYVVYKLGHTPKKWQRVAGFEGYKEVMESTTRITFELRTSDFVRFIDIKNKFQNCDAITNFTVITYPDKDGNDWNAAIKWDLQINDTLNEEYAQDGNSNHSYEFDMSCELYYYIIRDETYDYITEILLSLELNDELSVNTKSVLEAMKNEKGQYLMNSEDKFIR